MADKALCYDGVSGLMAAKDKPNIGMLCQFYRMTVPQNLNSSASQYIAIDAAAINQMSAYVDFSGGTDFTVLIAGTYRVEICMNTASASASNVYIEMHKYSPGISYPMVIEFGTTSTSISGFMVDTFNVGDYFRFMSVRIGANTSLKPINSSRSGIIITKVG